MTTGPDQSTASPSSPSDPVVARLSPFSRLVGIIFEPSETLRSISEKPDWAIPFVLIMLISIAVSMVILPHIDVAASVRQQMESKPNITEEKIQQAVSIGTKMAKFNTVITIVVVAVVLLIMAAVLLLAFRLFGGEGTFRQAFAVTVYSAIPSALLSIILAIIVLTRGMMTQQDMMLMLKSNVGAFLDPQTNPVLFAFLKSIDVFTIWRLILLIIGFSYVSKLSRGRSATIVISLWLVVVLFQVAFAAIGAAMS